MYENHKGIKQMKYILTVSRGDYPQQVYVLEDKAEANMKFVGLAKCLTHVTLSTIDEHGEVMEFRTNRNSSPNHGNVMSDEDAEHCMSGEPFPDEKCDVSSKDYIIG